MSKRPPKTDELIAQITCKHKDIHTCDQLIDKYTKAIGKAFTAGAAHEQAQYNIGYENGIQAKMREVDQRKWQEGYDAAMKVAREQLAGDIQHRLEQALAVIKGEEEPDDDDDYYTYTEPS